MNEEKKSPWGIRETIQNSELTNVELERRFAVNEKTISNWKRKLHPYLSLPLFHNFILKSLASSSLKIELSPLRSSLHFYEGQALTARKEVLGECVHGVRKNLQPLFLLFLHM